MYRWVASKTAVGDLDRRRMLEVGSFNVNGTVADLFEDPVGVDVRCGPNVDVAATAARLPFRDGQFDIVICTEMLEHDPTFWRSIPEMVRVLQPGGDLLVTTRGIGFPIHEFPFDYWRFTPDALVLLLVDAGVAVVEVCDDPSPDHPGVFAHGRKEAA